MTETELRARVVAQAEHWLGRNEADGSHMEIIDLYNTLRPAGYYKMTYTDPWCACYVSAVGMAAGLSDIILPSVNCDQMISFYRARGRWEESDSYTPQPGDLVMYDWADSGAGDNTGGADHVGIVVNVSGNVIKVIEGNKADAVGYRYIPVDGRYIRGFCLPDYASKADALSQPDKGSKNGTSSGTAVSAQSEVYLSQNEKTKDNKTEPTACTVELPIVRYGDEGEPVRAMQLLLIGRGYACGWHGADGEHGPATKSALVKFQAANGLTEAGTCAAETWEKLIIGG